MVSYTQISTRLILLNSVLILVVMEDGLIRMRVEGLTLDNRS